MTTTRKRTIPPRRRRVIPLEYCVINGKGQAPPPPPPSPPSFLTGEQLKWIGMARAEAAHPEWSALAKHVVYHIFAPTYEHLHSEMLTALIGKPVKMTEYKANNAVGSIFATAHKRGILKPVDRMNAVNPEGHANNRNVWVWTGYVFGPPKKCAPCPYCIDPPGFI